MTSLRSWPTAAPETAASADSWRERAACPSYVPFYLWDGDYAAEDCRQVCTSCPVINECLSDALSLAAVDDSGVRAGLSLAERDRLRSNRSAAWRAGNRVTR